MRIENEKEMAESGIALALTIVLMNVLILSILVGMLWLVQIIISQSNQLNDLVRGFNLM